MKTTQKTKKQLTTSQHVALIAILKKRFEKNTHRHKDIDWSLVQKKLEADSEKRWSINEMERTGGEPDVIGYDKKNNQYIFCDCTAESPKGRRSICYDKEGLDARKEFKPDGNAIDMATAMGISILNEEEYRALQQLEAFDTKTSSWIQTPAPIRKLGGAFFGDCRYGNVFIYHNGAQSYYAARGFRGLLKV
jgi:hypothetical protein